MTLFEMWARARPFIEPAIPELKGTHTIDDVTLMLGAGMLRLWLWPRSALLTEITLTPRVKALNCFLGGGDLDELRRMEAEQLVPFAKANGCNRITGGGRKGWKRVLPGYECGGIYMHKDI